MISTSRTWLQRLTLLHFFFISLAAYSQSAFLATYEDDLHQVVRIKGNSPYVSVKGKTKRGYFSKTRLEQRDSFGEGFVKITVVDSSILSHKRAEKANSAKASYLNYEVLLESDRNLSDCFCVLTLGINGSPTTRSKTVGTLTAGKQKRIQLTARATRAEVGRLHIYSKGAEIRSNQVSENYDVAEDEIQEIAASSHGVPANVLFHRYDTYPHALSPDGKFVVTFRDEGETNSVYIMDIDKGEMHRQINTGEFYEEIYDLQWISNEEYLFVVGRELKRGHIDKDELETLKNGVSRILYIMPLDPERILLRRGSRFFIFNLETLKTEENSSASENTSAAWFDEEGYYRLKGVVSGKDISFFVKTSRQSNWQPLDKTVTQENLNFNYSGDSRMDQSVFIDDFSPDPDKLYVYTTAQSDKAQLAEYSISEGRITRYLLGSKTYDLGGDDVPDTRLLYLRDSKRIIGAQFTGSRPLTKWFHPEFEAAQKMFDQAFPDAANTAIDWTNDASTILFLSRSEKHPGRQIVFRPHEKRAITVSDRLPILRSYDLGSTTPIKFESRDGHSIHGYLTLPPSHKGEAPPLIAYPHGGPYVRDTWGYDPYVQFYATRGYAVLQVNYRGSTGYGQTHLQAGISGVDTVMIDDFADGVRYCIEQGYADPERIGIFGASFGGYSVFMGMIKYPELYQAGVALASVTDYNRQLHHYRTMYGGGYALAFWKAALGKHDEKEFMTRISPVTHVDKIQGPLLIFHGKEDYVVPWEHSRLMSQALTKAGKEHKTIYFDEEVHGFIYIQNQIRYVSDAESFFAEHLTDS